MATVTTMTTTTTTIIHRRLFTKSHKLILRDYFLKQKQIILAYLSFLAVAWFILSPLFICIISVAYFGLIYGSLFLLTCCLYNHLEDKLHPRGLVGRQWVAFNDWIGSMWAHFENTMPVKVIKLSKEEVFSPSSKFLFCFHPHGVLFLGPATIANKITHFFPRLRISHLMSTMCFLSPVFRQYCLWIGGIPATKEAATQAVLEHGNSLSVIPGGLAEMLECDPRPRVLEDWEKPGLRTKNDDGTAPKQTVVLFLKNRKGFIKLALQMGLQLVPVFTFGEIETFHQVRWCHKLRVRISRFVKIPVTLIWGKYIILPRLTPLTVIVGEPIPVEMESNPSQEKVDELHSKYVDALCNIFEENKGKYGHGDARLVVL